LAKDVSVGAGAAAAACSNQVSSSRSAARVWVAVRLPVVRLLDRLPARVASGRPAWPPGRLPVVRFGRRSGREGVRAEGMRM
jgi:hypothetical protein